MGNRLDARRPADRGRRVCAPRGQDARRGGFTLMELILVLLLASILAGLAIAAFHGSLESVQARDSAERIVLLLRTASAEAANIGKRLRLAFDAQTGQPFLTVQADPLNDPTTFTPYHGWWVDASRLQAGVYVARCELTGPDAFYEPDTDPDALAAVNFYFDGTSDSARILLARRGDENVWAIEIVLNGVDGTITQRRLDPEENEQDAKLIEDLSQTP